MHIVSWWCGSCGFPVSPSSYLVMFHLCLGECYQCCEFNPLDWGLSWSLDYWFWLDSHQGVIMLPLINLGLLFPLHWFDHCNFLLWLGLMYLPLACIFPQMCHCSYNYSHHHHHCTNFKYKVSHLYGYQVLGWLVQKKWWERWCNYTVLGYVQCHCYKKQKMQ